MLSVDADEMMLEPARWVDRLAARLDKLLLFEPEVRRLGVNFRMKSSMVFTGDFSSNLSLTLRGGERSKHQERREVRYWIHVYLTAQIRETKHCECLRMFVSIQRG